MSSTRSRASAGPATTAPSGANAWVADGSLVIEARRDHIERRRYTSAAVITNGKREFGYGRSPQRLYVDYARVYRCVGQRT